MKLWKLILPALALISCSRNPALREAARLVEAYPDSALTVLEGISPATLSPRDKAEYDYLSAQAFYNTYFFLDDAHSINLSRAYRFKEQERNRLSNLAMLIAAILATLVLYDPVRSRQILERIPAGRWGEAADIAGACVFLCSPASDYINGIVLPVDGGWLAR